MNISGDSGGLFRGNGSIGNRVLVNSSPIHAATPPISQQPIISMEDDEISDQEIVSLHFFFYVELHKFLDRKCCRISGDSSVNKK